MSAAEQRAREDYDLTAEIDTDRLEDLLRPLDAVADEFLVELGEDGFRSCGVDPANILLTEVQAPAWYFDSLEGVDVEFGMYVPRLMEWLERVDGVVWMGYNASEKTLDLESDAYRYDYAVLDPDSVRSKDPMELDLDVELQVSPQEFREAVEYAEWCADHLRFEYSPDTGVLTATSENSTDKAVYRIGVDEPDVVSDGTANSLFSTDFAMDMAEGFMESRPLLLRLGEEYPMEAQYDLAVNEDGETATVSLLQAPRIIEE